MQRSRQGSVKVSHRQVQEAETTSRDLTKGELLTYIFTDFFRISYDVGAIFFDALILPELYLQRPAGSLYTLLLGGGSGGEFAYMLYMFGVIAVLEIGAIWLQILGYRRLWPKHYILGSKLRNR